MLKQILYIDTYKCGIALFVLGEIQWKECTILMIFTTTKKNRYKPYILKCCSCIYVPMFVLDTKKNKMAAHFLKVYNIVKKGH